MTETSTATGDEIFAVANNCLEQLGIRIVIEGWEKDDVKGEDLFEEFLEMMPAVVLFHENILANQNIYKVLKENLRIEVLNVRKERVPPITRSLRELFAEEADRRQAKQMIAGRSNSTGHVVTQPASESSIPPDIMQGRPNEAPGYRISSRYRDDLLQQCWVEHSSK